MNASSGLHIILLSSKWNSLFYMQLIYTRINLFFKDELHIAAILYVPYF